MGKDKRNWRKLVKKLRRKKLRQKAVHQNQITEEEIEESEDENVSEDLAHKLEEEKWLQREMISQDEFKKKQESIKREMEAIEEREKEEKRLKEEIRRINEEKKKKQVEKKTTLFSSWKGLYVHHQLQKDEEFDQLLNFLSGDLETPPVQSLMPETPSDGREICGFFSKTGICRFYSKCSRFHSKPMLSQVILIQNFFSQFFVEQPFPDKYDNDLSLEYEDSDLYAHFLDFYNDVLPEFQKHGKVIQFKVCANFEPHLRGNVYIQYETIREALQAFRIFNGRFYNGKNLSLSFVNIISWKAAICGLYARRKCPKGKSCNFLHVFRNPSNEFVNADEDRAIKVIFEIENKNKGILNMTGTNEKQSTTRSRRWSSSSPESGSDKKRRSESERMKRKRPRESSRRNSSSSEILPSRIHHHSHPEKEERKSAQINSPRSASLNEKSHSSRHSHKKHKVKKKLKHKHKYKKDKRKSH